MRECGLTALERGRVVRATTARPPAGPDGRVARVIRPAVDRWVRAYRGRGLAGLRPQGRSDEGAVRRQSELVTEAVALRRELPARSKAHIADILAAQHGLTVAAGTLREHFRRLGGAARSAGRRHAGIRPLRGQPAQRGLDRGCPARSLRPVFPRGEQPPGQALPGGGRPQSAAAARWLADGGEHPPRAAGAVQRDHAAWAA